MSINLKSYSVIDEDGQQYVEASFVSDNTDEPDEFLAFRIRLPEIGMPSDRRSPANSPCECAKRNR